MNVSSREAIETFRETLFRVSAFNGFCEIILNNIEGRCDGVLLSMGEKNFFFLFFWSLKHYSFLPFQF